MSTKTSGMATFRTLKRSFIAVGVALLACGGAPSAENPEYAAAASRAEAGLVAPLRDDTSEDIVSWVDGQVVTDWAAEIAKRQRAIDGYLNDERSGPRREVRFSQRTESPAGLELVSRQPGRVQRRAVRPLQDHSRPRSEPREPDAAHDRPNLEARSRRAVGRQRGRSITSASGPIPPITSTAWHVR